MLSHLMVGAVGITILVLGGDLLVRGASSLARSMGISPLAVGLTVVAFGTSSPELAVSVGAALSDSGTMAFGNIVGSNLANIGLVVGLAAIMRPIPIDSVVIRRELPMMLLAVAAGWVMAADRIIGQSTPTYERSDGLILLLFFFVFVYYTIGDLLNQRKETNRPDGPGGFLDPHSVDEQEDGPTVHVRRDIIKTIIGLVMLFGGAKLTVMGGVGVARSLGVPEVIVGLSLVSIGTSLPELVATLSAVRRGESAIAIGGVVGSNIFNILLVGGVTALIRPIQIPDGGLLDLTIMAVLSLLLLLLARTNSSRILRSEGLLLLTSYVGYMIWRVWPSPLA
jgi:cation:H+ antiporter